jgi:MerR family redox-sensitive transcriptional activator SoxR
MSSGMSCYNNFPMLEVKVDFKSRLSTSRSWMVLMKIGELARRARLNPSAIRYYEKVGVLNSPHRARGQRRYPDEALDRVLLVRFASEMGFTLAEIRLFLRGLRDDGPVGPRWRKLAQRKITEVEETLERTHRLKSLLEHLLRCRCASLQVCVERLRLSPSLKLIRKRPAAD